MCSLEDVAMRQDRRVDLYKELRGPGSLHVMEAMKLVGEEITDFDDYDDLPETPAGGLIKAGGSDGRRVGQ
jgi:hypothetical protein